MKLLMVVFFFILTISQANADTEIIGLLCKPDLSDAALMDKAEKLFGKSKELSIEKFVRENEVDRSAATRMWADTVRMGFSYVNSGLKTEKDVNDSFSVVGEGCYLGDTVEWESNELTIINNQCLITRYIVIDRSSLRYNIILEYRGQKPPGQVYIGGNCEIKKAGGRKF